MRPECETYLPLGVAVGWERLGETTLLLVELDAKARPPILLLCLWRGKSMLLLWAEASHCPGVLSSVLTYIYKRMDRTPSRFVCLLLC